MSAGELALSAAERVGSSERIEDRLVELCRQGDTEAFTGLVARHEGMVFNLAARLLGDREEARDAAQEVFLQVFRQLARFQGRSSLKTWIYRIVVNHCRNRQRWWRRRRLDRACTLEDLSPSEEAQLAKEKSSQPSPFELVRRREQAQRLQEALRGVSFDHRAILLLREVEGLSGDEIAAALRIPAGTVKSRLARAREAIRRRLLADGKGKVVS